MCFGPSAIFVIMPLSATFKTFRFFHGHGGLEIEATVGYADPFCAAVVNITDVHGQGGFCDRNL